MVRFQNRIVTKRRRRAHGRERLAEVERYREMCKGTGTDSGALGSSSWPGQMKLPFQKTNQTTARALLRMQVLLGPSFAPRTANRQG